MKHEYHEGPKAGENFKNLATAVFKTKKVANPKRQPKPKPSNGKNESQRAFLFPRPCLRLAHAVFAFAGQLRIS